MWGAKPAEGLRRRRGDLRVEHNQRNLAATKHAQLHRLLYQAILALRKGSMPTTLVLNLANYDLFPTHRGRPRVQRVYSG